MEQAKTAILAILKVLKPDIDEKTAEVYIDIYYQKTLAIINQAELPPELYTTVAQMILPSFESNNIKSISEGDKKVSFADLSLSTDYEPILSKFRRVTFND